MNQRTMLAALHASPDDAALRLIFGDWLEEHGKPTWAEAVRRHARLPGPDGWADRPFWPPADPPGLYEGLDLAALRREMGYPLPLDPSDLCAALPAQVTLDALTFLAVAADLAAWGPLPRIRLTGMRKRLGELAASPALGDVESLVLVDDDLQEDDTEAFLRSPHLANVRELSFSAEGAPWRNRFTARSVRALAEAPALGGLRRLHLAGRNVGDEGLSALAAARWPDLEELDLVRTRVTGRGFTDFLRPVFPILRRLHLGKNRLCGEGVACLSASPQSGTLEGLHLSDAVLADPDIVGLARSPNLGRLRVLDVRNSAVANAGFLALAKCGALAGLARLDLGGDHGGGVTDLSPLGHAVFADSLRSLNLAGHPVGDAGAVALTASPLRLRSLDLHACGIGRVGGAALVAWPGLARLEVADFHGNGLGPDAVDLKLRFYAASPSLSFASERLGDEGVARLLARPEARGLKSLDLSWNGLTAEAVRLISECPALAGLEQLTLDFNGVTDEGAAALLASPFLTKLRHLRLNNCGVTAAGVAPLVSRYGEGVFHR